MRLFVALNLPPTHRTGIHDAMAPLRGEGLPLRWVRPDTLHLTLVFLGEVSREEGAAAGAALASVVPRHPTFELELGGLGMFPDGKRPRVLWLGAGAADLAGLQDDVEAALVQTGVFEPDERRFRGHVTLARVRGRLARAEARVLRARAGTLDYRARVRIDTVDLMRSRPGRTGARYEALHRFTLDSGRGDTPW